MKVFATTAMQEPGVATYRPLFGELAARDRFGVHRLTEDPEEADLILFLDGHQHYRDLELNAIRQHPLTVQHRRKSFVYCELDQPWCAMPGLYVAMPKRSFNARRQRACAYLTMPNPHMTSVPPAGETGAGQEWLYSFMGRSGNLTRERILRQTHPRAQVVDTTSTDFFGSPTEEIARQKQRYADVIARSKFVLCPVGAGPSSFRIFETMAAGRVPVILSDEWVPPRGPDWENCALFIPENRVDELGAILEQHESRFPALARTARREWEQWFAPDVHFHRLVEAMRELLEAGPESALGRKLNARYLRLRARAAKGSLRGMLRRAGEALRGSRKSAPPVLSRS